jgi:hypothetical protein
MRGYVSNWIPPAPSIVHAEEVRPDLGDAVAELNHQNMFKIPIPNTKLGTVRSASLVECQLIGLYLTEDSVHTMLRVYEQLGQARKAARRILNLLSGDDEVILVTQKTLDDLELRWTGTIRPTRKKTNFFAKFRFAAYINLSWDIVREISYLAVSKAAFDILMTAARFKTGRKDIVKQTKFARKIRKQSLDEAFDRLRYTSSSQTLMAAISCTAYALSPIPKRVRDFYLPPAKDVAFTQIGRDLLRETIHHAYMGPSKRLNEERRADELSFIRSSNKREQISGVCKDDTTRLNRSNPFTSLGPLTISDYGVVLVAGLTYKETRRQWRGERYDICLYIVEEVPGIEEITALPVIIEDLIQSSHIYHTIGQFITSRPNQFPDYGSLVWNLPCTYWPCDTQELADVREWIKELQGKPTKGFRNDGEDLWERIQTVMAFLKAEDVRRGKRADGKPRDRSGKSTPGYLRGQVGVWNSSIKVSFNEQGLPPFSL